MMRNAKRRGRNLDAPADSESERLKILFLPGWFPSETNPTAGTFIREHAQAAARYHDVTVLYATRADSGPRGRWRVDSDRVEEGIRTVRISWRELPIAKTSFALHLYVLTAAYRYLRRSEFAPDIIHGHIFFMAPAAMTLGSLFRRPVVITEHSPAFFQGEVGGQMLWMARRAFRRAAMILPVSSWLQRSMQSHGIRGRFRVIPNAINPEVFFPSPHGTRRNANRDTPRLLTVGLLSEAKGIPILLRAASQVRKRGKAFRLDIVGDGPEKTEYERQCTEIGMQGMVAFHGLKTKPEVAELMRQCAFYIQPSLWETFSVAIIEAMACGKPVIATEIPAFEEKIRADRGILVPPGDVDALASAIDNMLDRYEEFASTEIAEYARANFGQAAVGMALSDVYREVHSPH